MTTFQCPACGFVSHNPNDAKHRYCVRCHRFVDDEPPVTGEIRNEAGRRIVLIAPSGHVRGDFVRCPYCGGVLYLNNLGRWELIAGSATE